MFPTQPNQNYFKYVDYVCPICFEKFEEARKPQTKCAALKCGHVFHAVCLAGWFDCLSQYQCPTCSVGVNRIRRISMERGLLLKKYFSLVCTVVKVTISVGLIFAPYLIDTNEWAESYVNFVRGAFRPTAMNVFHDLNLLIPYNNTHIEVILTKNDIELMLTNLSASYSPTIADIQEFLNSALRYGSIFGIFHLADLLTDTISNMMNTLKNPLRPRLVTDGWEHGHDLKLFDITPDLLRRIQEKMEARGATEQKIKAE